MIHYLLDTNILIYILNQHPEVVFHKFNQVAADQVGMSIISYGELLFGTENSLYQKKSKRLLEALAQQIPVLPLTTIAGHHYGKIRASLKKTGNLIGPNDLWIAAHALSLNTILVTNNTKEFSRVPHLKVENWLLRH